MMKPFNMESCRIAECNYNVAHACFILIELLYLENAKFNISTNKPKAVIIQSIIQYTMDVQIDVSNKKYFE